MPQQVKGGTGGGGISGQGAATAPAAGSAPLAQTALITKITAGKNPRARMQTTLHGLRNQLTAAIAAGNAQTWLDSFNGAAIDAYCTAMEGPGAGTGTGGGPTPDIRE